MSSFSAEPAAEANEPGDAPAEVAAAEAATMAPAQRPKRALWRSGDFLKFWTGQSVSKFGDQFALLALPLLILSLTHSPLALGLSEIPSMVPYLLLSLPAGALIDRLPRRLVMIVCDITRTLALGAIVAALLAHLPNIATLWIIYATIAVTSIATIFFDMAYLTATPNIVPAEQLLSANSAMQTSESTSELAGPPLAGLIFQALGAASALLGDALSFAVSAISLALIRRDFRAAPAQNDAAPAAKRSLLRDIKEGLRFVWGLPVLRWTMLLIAIGNFTSNAAFPLWLFRMQGQLRYSAGLIGVILAFQAVGGIIGSFLAGRLRQRFGMLPMALVAMLLEALLFAGYGMADQPWLFMLIEVVLGAAIVTININILTLRQSVTPDHLMGRMQSVARLIAYSLIPLGAAVGTALAGPFGVTPVIVSASALLFVVALGAFLSPIRRMG